MFHCLCKPLRLLVLGLTAICSSAQALEVNGIAAYSEFGKEVFLGALYLEKRTGNVDRILAARGEKKLELRFVDDMSRRRWVNLWMQSIAINNSNADLKRHGKNLSRVFAAFREGPGRTDVVAIIQRRNGRTDFELNGLSLESVSAAGFFNLFSRAWVGPVPPSTQFKNALLGQSEQVDLASRFLKIKPSRKRLASTRVWAKPVDNKPVRHKTEDNLVSGMGRARLMTVSSSALSESGLSAASRYSARAPASRNEPNLSSDSLIAQQNYANGVVQQIYRQLIYPRRAVQKEIQGSVRMNVEIRADGSVASTAIAEASDHALLNKEALRAIEKAAPFDRFPGEIGQQSLTLTVPVSFRLPE